MRKALVTLITALTLLLASAGAASAHTTGPCFDPATPTVTYSGAEYAEHHISAMAKAGELGNGGHKPGAHRGYSACLGVHQ